MARLWRDFNLEAKPAQMRFPTCLRTVEKQTKHGRARQRWTAGTPGIPSRLDKYASFSAAECLTWVALLAADMARQLSDDSGLTEAISTAVFVHG